MLPEEETVKQAETLVINIPMFEKGAADVWWQLVAIISSSLSCSCFGVNLEFLMIKNKNELKKGQMSDDSWRQSSVAAYPAAAAAAVE